jgi:hypothetical protein
MTYTIEWQDFIVEIYVRKKVYRKCRKDSDISILNILYLPNHVYLKFLKSGRPQGQYVMKNNNARKRCSCKRND